MLHVSLCYAWVLGLFTFLCWFACSLEYVFIIFFSFYFLLPFILVFNIDLLHVLTMQNHLLIIFFFPINQNSISNCIIFSQYSCNCFLVVLAIYHHLPQVTMAKKIDRYFFYSFISEPHKISLLYLTFSVLKNCNI